MNALVKIFSISFALSFAQWDTAFGQAFIYPGIQPGTEAGLSQINTRGASSILWNPANLVVTPPALKSRPDKKTKGRRGVEVYGDVSIMSVNYSYTREGAPPLKVSLTAPPVNLGFSWRPQNRFAIGAFFIPRPTSKSTLTDYPFPEGGSVKPSNVEQSGGSVVSGFGVGIKANPNLSLGLSLIETAEQNTQAVYFQDSASDVPFVQLESSGSFIQFLFGVRARVSSSVTIGASIKTPVTKKYSGSISLEGSAPEETQKKGYSPTEISVGAGRKSGSSALYGEYRRHGWAAGTSQVNEGTPNAPVRKDYKDMNVFIFGGRYNLSKTRGIGAAYGYYPSNVGFGSSLGPDGKSVDGDLVGGVAIGDFDGLNRHVVAGSYRMEFQDAYFQMGASMQNASRDVPANKSAEGTHSLSVMTLAFGGAKTF